MPAHDIIDNRKEKLVDHINRILSSTESARFAVGYLGKSKKGKIIKATGNELTYSRYGLYHYVDKEKQKREP